MLIKERVTRIPIDGSLLDGPSMPAIPPRPGPDQPRPLDVLLGYLSDLEVAAGVCIDQRDAIRRIMATPMGTPDAAVK